jgi:hypothetical protein
MPDASALRAALQDALVHCADNGIELAPRLLDGLELVAVKTEAYYSRVLSKAVRDLYNGKISADDFLTTESRLLDEQIVRAWNEGMRLNDLNPQSDMTPEWEAIVKEIQDSEFQHVQGFMDAIEQAAKDKQPIQPLLDRADLWSGEYQTTVTRAQVVTAPKDLNFVWHFGNTIEHCDTCAALNGIVAPAAEWAKLHDRGIYPQSDKLACHGFKCECGLDPTDDKVTPGGIPSV